MCERWIETFREQLRKEKDIVAILANFSAYLNVYLDEINWVGFYRVQDQELILGPFQGKAACTRIPIGKGVCGDSVKEKRVIRVKNVKEYKGHIACDFASKSEIVLPIMKDQNVVAVLDIDSPIEDRFSEEDEKNLLKIVALLETLEW